jgi:hypothetical protein
MFYYFANYKDGATVSSVDIKWNGATITSTLKNMVGMFFGC